MNTPKINDWHSPSNEDCSQNQNIALDCTCKRSRNRRPFRVVRVTDRDKEGCRKQLEIILEIHPDGIIALREKGRKTRFTTTARKIYEGILWNEAMARLKARKKNKGGRK